MGDNDLAYSVIGIGERVLFPNVTSGHLARQERRGKQTLSKPCMNTRGNKKEEEREMH